MAYNPKWNVLNRIIDGDTRIAVIDDEPNSRALIEIDGTQVADFRSEGFILASGVRVDEFSDDGTLAGDLDTSVPTEKAVKTYVDNAIGNLDPDKIWQDDSYVQVVDDGTNAGYVKIVADGVEVVNVSEAEQVFGKSDDTHISILDGTATVPVGSVEAFAIDEDGISVELGATVNEFSVDGTLAGDSDTALPTEQAVKTYVDAQIGGVSNIIFEDDSYVKVVDDGTADGYAEVVIDGVQVQYWDSQAATIRMGKSSGAGRIEVNDTEINHYVGSTQTLSTSATRSILGDLTDTRIDLISAGGAARIYADNVAVLQLTAGSQIMGTGGTTLVTEQGADTIRAEANGNYVMQLAPFTQLFGHASDSRLELDRAGNTADLYAGTVQVIDTSQTSQIFGVSGDARLELDQTGDTFLLAAGANTQISGGLDTMTLGVAGDTTIVLDQTADQVAITAGGESQLLIETQGVSVYEDLTVTGNLYVDGTTWVVHNQEVTTSDNLIVINYGEVGPGVTAGYAGFEVDRGSEPDYRFIFAEDTDTFRIGEIADGTTAVNAYLQAVATREDAPGTLRVPWWNNTENRFDTAGSSRITIDVPQDEIEFIAGNGIRATASASGFKLAVGINCNEFSVDGTLGGNSDSALPTEKAVKTYVDAQIGGVSNTIFQGDSHVTVVDDGTDAGYIEVVADGVQVQYWDAAASSMRMGKSSGAGRIIVSDNSITGYVDAVTTFSFSETNAIIGKPSDTNITMDYIGNVMAFDCNNILVASLNQSVQRIGLSGDTSMTISNVSNSFTFEADTSEVASLNASGLQLGASGARVTTISTSTALGSSDTILVTQGAVKSYTDTGDSNTLSAAQSYADAGDATGLIDAQAYADAGDVATLSSANSYADGGDTATLSSAEAYTDQEIDALRAELDLTNVKYVFSDTTAISGDVLLVDTTAGDVNIDLLEANDSKVVIKKVTGDAFNVIVSTSPGTIDGKASVTLDTKYQAYHFVSDGVNFYIL